MTTVLAQTSSNTPQNNIPVSFTVTVSSYIVVVVTQGQSVLGFTGVSDGTNTYVQQSQVLDSTNDQGFARYITTAPVAPGTYTATATFSTTSGALGIAVAAIPFTSTGQLGSLAGNVQYSPGTGVGAVTTGTSGTWSSQPVFLEAWSLSSSGTSTLSAAGGSTLDPGSPFWTAVKANFLFLETQSLTSGGSLAGTFTSSLGTGAEISLGGVWATPPTLLMGQILT